MKTPVSLASLFWLNAAVLFIPAVEVTTCTQGSTDAWLISLIVFAPLVAILSLTSLVGLKSAKMLRWFTVPQILILPFAIYVVSKYLVGVNFQNIHPCAIAANPGFKSYPFDNWVLFWAPAQLFVLAICGYVVIKFWRVGANG